MHAVEKNGGDEDYAFQEEGVQVELLPVLLLEYEDNFDQQHDEIFYYQQVPAEIRHPFQQGDFAQHVHKHFIANSEDLGEDDEDDEVSF